MNASQKNFIPTIISRIFDPLTLLSGITILGISRSELTGSALIFFLTITLLGTVILPFSLLAWALRTKRISDWDLHKRQERIIPLGLLSGIILIDLFLAYIFHNVFLITLFSFYLAWVLGFFVITLKWKISGHAAGVTLVTGLLITWFGSQFWPLLFIIPLVSWARVVRKDHTVAQVIAGTAYSLIMLSMWSTIYP